jgi:hypothetical protein
VVKKDSNAIKVLLGHALYTSRHVLGAAKKKAVTKKEKKAVNHALEDFRRYRKRLDAIFDGRKKEGKGMAPRQLKLRGSQFGNLVTDPVSLHAGKPRAFDGGSLLFEAPADQTFYDLLTKRFVKTHPPRLMRSKNSLGWPACSFSRLLR